MAEICERRLERFKRRESLREVQKKKKDLQDTYRRLEEARKVNFVISSVARGTGGGAIALPSPRIGMQNMKNTTFLPLLRLMSALK